ncbi:MAG: hypothetical protein AB1490_26300 [Pseudomonadota bacterium]
MSMRLVVVSTGVLVGALIFASSSAQALTMQECSVKYKAAQSAGTLQGMKWNDFRKAECGAGATAAPASATTTAPPPAAPPATTAAKPMAPATTTGTRSSAAPTAAPAPMGNAVFPNAVSPKYSSESAGKARMHTCLDQYNANKAGSGNGGLNWIQKGGGYYSECNKRLKGA